MTDTSTVIDLKADDAALIARVQAGDQDAYEPRVLRYQDRIFSVVLRMVSNRDDAQDLTQEAFISAYRGLGSFRSESAFSTWLYRIAVNTVISFRRRRRPVVIASIAPGEDADSPGVQLDPADAKPGPVDRAQASERQAAVLAAVNQLEPEFRDAVALRDLQGCSYDEMAQALGCPVGTVKSRIHRARLALRELLAPLIDSIEL